MRGNKGEKNEVREKVEVVRGNYKCYGKSGGEEKWVGEEKWIVMGSRGRVWGDGGKGRRLLIKGGKRGIDKR